MTTQHHIKIKCRIILNLTHACFSNNTDIQTYICIRLCYVVGIYYAIIKHNKSKTGTKCYVHKIRGQHYKTNNIANAAEANIRNRKGDSNSGLCDKG